MEVEKLIACLLILGGMLFLMVVGHGIFTLLFKTIRPLEIWANKQIEEMESYQCDDEYEFDEEEVIVDECKSSTNSRMSAGMSVEVKV